MSDTLLIEQLNTRQLLSPPREIGMSHAMTFLLQQGAELPASDQLQLKNGETLPLQPFNTLYTEVSQPDLEARLVALCMATEFAIAFADHASEHSLQDPEVIVCLEQLALKPEASLKGLGARIQGYLRLELSLADYSRSDLRNALRRCLRSAQRHHKSEGARGYLAFIHHLIH